MIEVACIHPKNLSLATMALNEKLWGVGVN
jgi:hypothetical protein